MTHTAPAMLCLLLVISTGALAGEISDQTVGTDAIKAIRVTGGRSRLDVTAGGNGPYVTTLRGQRQSGLLSNLWPRWLKSDCTTMSYMTIDGGTLLIHIDSGSRGNRCDVTVTAHVPAGVALTVDLGAVETRLDGEFGRIDIDGKASDIRFSGHATALTVRGGAIHASVALARSDKNERLHFDAPSVNAEFRFPPALPISYRIDGAAYSVASERQNTPGALPALAINGSAVNVAIR